MSPSYNPYELMVGTRKRGRIFIRQGLPVVISCFTPAMRVTLWRICCLAVVALLAIPLKGAAQGTNGTSVSATPSVATDSPAGTNSAAAASTNVSPESTTAAAETGPSSTKKCPWKN